MHNKVQNTVHQSFSFLNWELNLENYQLILHYNIESIGQVSEILTFPAFTLKSDRVDAVNTACELVHLMCGISYYKAGLAKEIVFKDSLPNKAMAEFIKKTWFHGLGELSFENNVSLKNHINIPFNDKDESHSSQIKLSHKALVPLGGGKDSLVTVEELKVQAKDITLFMVGNAALIKEVAAFIDLPLIQVMRKIDRQLIDYNKTGKGFNGHIPITAINSAIAALTALLFDFNEIVFSNEKSADSANTVNSDGDEVNHQYSKSMEFEQDFRQLLASEITPSLDYYSQQRDCSELEILEKFSHYPQYFSIFSSCNRNFHINGSHNKNTKWCNNCPKCRFIFLGLAPFVDKSQLLNIFGHNLLDDMNQKQGFSELLGIQGFKPFECVGEISESLEAFNSLKNKPEWKHDSLVNSLSAQLSLSDSQFSLKNLRNKKIAIWGYGVEGKATAEYLVENNLEFTVLCQPAEVDSRYDCMTDSINTQILNIFDVVIKSPGISAYDSRVKDTTAEVTSSTALWFANEKNTQVIAVSGTKGKSTTVSLLAHILDYCGKSVHLVGNIGQPLISVNSDVDYIVLEASSFQIYDGNIQADIALITNLSAEHVDWHEGKDNYFRDKLKLLSLANSKIINAKSSLLTDSVNNAGMNYFNIEGGYYVEATQLKYKNKVVLNSSQISLIGQHNLENIGAALTVCQQLNLEISQCVSAVISFKPLAHRLQNLGRIGQHYAINDSIATTSIATIAALQTMHRAKTTLLVGGYDRGHDWSDFVKSLCDCPPNLLIISGQNAAAIDQLLKTMKTTFDYLVCDNLKQAILLAQNKSNVGDTILLSPGAPSFDQFDSYIARGDFFVKELNQNV
jgi:UDP-N-acetylmuramoylalanine--D-glutamate ligase